MDTEAKEVNLRAGGVVKSLKSEGGAQSPSLVAKWGRNFRWQ